jgi:hypothetical protein
MIYHFDWIAITHKGSINSYVGDSFQNQKLKSKIPHRNPISNQKLKSKTQIKNPT